MYEAKLLSLPVLFVWIYEVGVQWHSPERDSVAGQTYPKALPLQAHPLRFSKQSTDAVLIVASKAIPE